MAAAASAQAEEIRKKEKHEDDLQQEDPVTAQHSSTAPREEAKSQTVSACACAQILGIWEDYEEKWSERYLQQAASMQKAQQGERTPGGGGGGEKGLSAVLACLSRTRPTGPGRPRKAWLCQLVLWLCGAAAAARCAQGMEPCP